MMEVIDLTLDSPPPKDGANDDKSTRKKEERRKRRKEKGETSEERKREKREATRERDSHRSSRREHDRDADDRKRRRESSRERDPDTKRARHHSDRKRERDPDSPVPDNALFYVDETPTALPAAARYTAATAEESPALILPPHVSVFGETPAAILPAEPLDSDEDDYIEYLDYDNRKDFIRYYEEKPEERRIKIVCKKCGAEGEHTTAECTVLICTTCGARDDHSTRSCNIGKTCFNCGMKGHINSDCPNRRANIRSHGCERCGSSSHQTSECPTLWRLYVYQQDDERERILQTRKAKKGLALGQGGEGYIANDAWCYNCGGSDHWGDDCREFYHPEPLGEPTAFSYHVLSWGPFPVPEHASDSRTPREWVREVPLPGGIENVGRQARRKEMEKLARRAQQQEADDPADWFQNSRNEKNRGASGRDRERSQSGPRKVAGSSAKGPPPFKFAAASSSKLSLIDRLTAPAPDRPRDATSGSKSRDRHSDSRDRAADSRHRNEHERDSRKERERDKERRPRYNGGYSR